MAEKTKASEATSANIGFEAKLWLAADKLRNNMDAAEYKHVVLGLIFLKYISDSFEAHHAKLKAGSTEKTGDYAGANPEDPDEYRAENIFWVPPAARWSDLQGRAKLPSIGKDVDDAMDALERDNPRLKGALNKNYGRADLDKHRLGELIDLIGSIELKDAGHQSKDILGRVFEYFLTQFASAEGKSLTDILPSSFLLQTLPRLALRGIEADFGKENADTFRAVQHPDLRADYVLANPPFNDSDWHRKDDDVRWRFGVPPKGNANFAWVQHFIHHLAPQGMAGFVFGKMKRDIANAAFSLN